MSYKQRIVLITKDHVHNDNMSIQLGGDQETSKLYKLNSECIIKILEMKLMKYI